MDRRSEERVRRRIACEFEWGDRHHKGIALDVSAIGLFIQMDASSVPGPGSQIELRLIGSHSFPEMELVCEVVRRQVAAAMLGAVVRRGIALRVLEAPEAFYEAIGARRPAALDLPGEQPSATESDSEHLGALESDSISFDIEIEIDPDIGEPGRADRNSGSEVDVEIELDEGPLGVEVPLPAHRTLDTELAKPAPRAVERPRQAEAEWSGTSADPEEEVVESAPPVQAPAVATPARAPTGLKSLSAIVVDEGGELADVYQMLEEIGAKPVRARLSGPTRFQGWDDPPRLLVVAARAALEIERPPQVGLQGVVTIAVAEAESQTLCALLQRLGYQYIVRRPVHPEALRLLLLRSLYRDFDQRHESRLPAGHEVVWWHGWRPHPGVLLEISRGGCRIETHSRVPIGGTVAIRIAGSFSGSRGLSLTGSVVRRLERSGPCERPVFVMAVAFRDLAPRVQNQLAELLRFREIGPATLGRRSWWFRAFARVAELLQRPPDSDAKTEARPSQPAPEPRAPDLSEQRTSKRAVLDREVLTLSDSHQVQYVLMGRDLSEGGIRVEPHPMLALGERLDLALYDGGLEDPVVVSAEVSRDDAEHGLLLRFVEPSTQVTDSLRQIVESLPALTDNRIGAEPAKVTLARILPRKNAASKPGSESGRS